MINCNCSDLDIETWIVELPSHVSGEIQTRSEITGLQQHKTLDEAITRIMRDESVWKISYLTTRGWKKITVPNR